LGSPDIIKHVSSGVPIGDCTLTFVKSTEGWAKYRTIVLSSVRITEYQMLDSRGFDREAFEKPTECFVLNYNEISDTVHKFGFAGTDDGQNSMTYNILNNEAS
jgi:type VI protein secretion system component Hcp